MGNRKQLVVLIFVSSPGSDKGSVTKEKGEIHCHLQWNVVASGTRKNHVPAVYGCIREEKGRKELINMITLILFFCFIKLNLKSPILERKKNDPQKKARDDCHWFFDKLCHRQQQ